jgi:hypothetical protein
VKAFDWFDLTDLDVTGLDLTGLAWCETDLRLVLKLYPYKKAEAHSGLQCQFFTFAISLSLLSISGEFNVESGRVVRKRTQDMEVVTASLRSGEGHAYA